MLQPSRRVDKRPQTSAPKTDPAVNSKGVPVLREGTELDRRQPFVLLEDRRGSGNGLLYQHPIQIIRCEHESDVEQAFTDIDAGLQRGLYAAIAVSYELGQVLEPSVLSHIPKQRQAPLIWCGLFPEPKRLTGLDIDPFFAAVGPPPPLTDITFGHDRCRHIDKVTEVLRLIAAGDIYQANLTFPIDFRYDADPLALYAALRVSQPVAHGGIVSMGDMTILSVSPELFVEVQGDLAKTRPMKGTAPRSNDPSLDEKLRSELSADPKQRAENLMIVDLLRNDLSRISKPGSVRVPALFEVETYPTFQAMTSTIASQLLQGIGLRERLTALFPCGSVVGAPKLRASQILAELEGKERGFYTGAIGRVDPNRDMSLNVAIRTAVVTASGKGRYGVGGGIVADSDPAAEFGEALLKARILTDLSEDYKLVETMRWTRAAGYIRLEQHLARLAQSSEDLGFSCDLTQLRERLAGEAEAYARLPDDQRVKTTLDRGGSVTMEAARIADTGTRLKLAIASTRLDTADPFLRYSTTRRTIHRAALQEAQTHSRDAAILLNKEGNVADGSDHSIFISVGDRLITPRLEDGALPGVLRAEMISSGVAQPEVVTLEILVRAERIILGNSVLGLQKATLEGALALSFRQFR